MKTLILAAAVPVLLLAQPGGTPGGQEPTSMKGVVRKNKAPISNEVLRVKLPKPVEMKLKNGVTLLVLENHKLPTVVLELVMPFSPLNDPPDLRGVAEATVDMLKLGTKTRSSRQIAETLAELGANLNISTAYGSRSTRATLSTLTESLDPALDLLADVLLNPSFPEDEFNKYRQREISALTQARSQPQFLGNERLFQLLYDGDPRAVTASSPEALRKLTRDDLVRFYKERVHPAGALLGVAGDVTPKQIAAKLDARFSNWKAGEAAKTDLPIRGPIAAKKVVLVNRPNSVQSYIMTANRAIDRLSPDYIPVTVMNKVLGQGPTARLFLHIREEKGYTYGIYSSVTATRFLNHFSVATSVRNEVTAPALEEILKEFQEIRENLVPADELNAAKRSIVAGFALGLESQAGLLSQAMLLKEYGLPSDYWDTYPEKVMAVTAEQTRAVARKYVPYDNVQVVIVGDAAKIKDSLAKFGPIEEVQAN